MRENWMIVLALPLLLLSLLLAKLLLIVDQVCGARVQYTGGHGNSSLVTQDEMLMPNTDHDHQDEAPQPLHCQPGTNRQFDHQNSRGIFSSFVKYMDKALDFLFKTFFGDKNTKPYDDSDNEEEEEDEDDGYALKNAKLSRKRKVSGKEKVSYKGFQLLRIWPRSQEVIDDLHILIEQPLVQLWSWPPMSNTSVDILLPPDIAPSIKHELQQHHIQFSVLSNNVQKIISSQKTAETNFKHKLYQEENLETDSKYSKLDHNKYHSLEDIYGYLEYLRKTHSNLVETVIIGKSGEGRELKMVKISTSRSSDGSLKPTVWIDGGTHAREWISVAVALYIVRQLVEHNKSYKNLLQDLDWYILPVANPDGYVYTHTTDRLWSKSRSTSSASTDTATGPEDDEDSGRRGRYFWDDGDDEKDKCVGVDLNRNWQYRWKDNGLEEKDDPCDNSYCGSAPFSESETRSISNFILDNRERLMVYLTLHSYSQTWLIPFSSTTASERSSRDYDDLLYMGRKAVEAMKKSHGTNYHLLTKYPSSRFTSGSSADWVKNKVGVKYSYTIELRDTGTYGFLLPPSEIVPTGKEIFTAVRTLTRSILNNSLRKM